MTEATERRAIIASRLKDARRMAGLSQAQVANILGLQRPSVSEMEAGNRKVTAEEIAQLAELYDVSASWLLGEGKIRLTLGIVSFSLRLGNFKNLNRKTLIDF